MRIALVSPPSLCFPNPIYYALPMLAGALKGEGHSVRQVDLNVLAADRLLTPQWTERILDVAEKALVDQVAAGGRREVSPLETIIKRNAPLLSRAPDCKKTLRDADAYLDAERFKPAFDTVNDALSFCYMLDSVISVYDDSFSRRVIEHLESEPWSPLRDLMEETLVDEVLLNDPELVGISLAYQEQILHAVTLAGRIRKRRKDIHVCFGGLLVSFFPDKWLEDGWLLKIVDSLVVGDGETAIKELVEALEGKRSIERVRNLVFLNSKGGITKNNEEPFLEDMNRLPTPDFDSADMNPYFIPEPIYPIMTSRGCYWARCAFCSFCCQRGFRVASKEKVREDVLALSRNHGARFVMVQDSCITPRSALDLARIVKEESLPLHWISAARIERIFKSKTHCQELAEGGCRSLMLGFESASQRLLDKMDKGYRVEDLPAILANLREAGISAELLWFIGFPTETRDEVLQTARFLAEHGKNFGMAVLVGQYGLYTDTLVFEKKEDFGVVIDRIENGLCHFHTQEGMTPEETEELVRRFAPTSNLILACNGAHLPHLVEKGLDITRVANAMFLPKPS